MTMEQPPELAADRLLSAAAAEFRRHGVAGATVRGIAQSAGVLPGSLTYRFPTKESLVVALMEQAGAHISAAVLEAIDGCADPLERLRLAMRAHLRVLLGGGDAAYVLLFDWRRLSEHTRAALSRERHRYESIWDGLIYAAAASGQLAGGLDLALVRRFAFGAVNSVAFWYREGEALSPDQIADAFSHLIGLGTLSARARRGLESAGEARGRPRGAGARKSREARSTRMKGHAHEGART